MSTLESELKRLPEPALPAGLAERINARIAFIEEAPAPGISEPSRTVPAETSRDGLAWALALTGMAVGVGAFVYRLITGETAIDLVSPRTGGGLGGVVDMLPATPAVVVLAAGLLLYLAGLLAATSGTGIGRQRA